ncbi:hypothetical protein VB816_12610 [Limnoraphis robusta CCNP1324]|nr:hypothetical protein [Limnoraphis robusta CCNP1324]
MNTPVENPMNFLNWISEIVNSRDEFKEYQEEFAVETAVQGFINEFNTWLDSNYVDVICQQHKINDINAIDLNNNYFQRYCELIYLDATHFIKPIRYLFVSEIELLETRLMIADIQYQRKKELERLNNDEF